MTDDTASRGLSPRQWGVIVFLVGSLLYLPSVTYDFTFDDGPFIRQNTVLHHPSLYPYVWTRSYRGDVPGENLGHIRPVTTTTYALTWWAFGDTPAPFHVVNALLHGCNGLLLFWFVRRGFHSDRLAICTALLFAVHPLHVEAVANIVGRAELLVVMFGLLAWGIHLGGDITPKRAALGGLLWLLALLSKANALPLIAMFATSDWLLGRDLRRENAQTWWRGRAMLYGAHAVALVVHFAMRWAVLGAVGSPAMDRMPHNPLSLLGFADRLPTAIAVLGLQWRLFAWPHPLRPDYSFNAFPAAESMSDVRLLGAIAATVILLVLLVWGIRRQRSVALGVLAWGFGVAMTANIAFTIGHLFAERNLYLPSIGMCLLVGAAGAALWQRWKWSAWAMGAVALVFAVMTLNAERYWKSDEALFLHAVETTPESTQVWTNLAAVELGQALESGTSPEREAALLREVEAHALHALEIWPQNFKATFQLAHVALLRNRGAEAKRWLDQTLDLLPTYSAAISIRCNVALVEGDTETIDRVLNTAISLNPNHEVALTLRVKTLLSRGRAREALAIAERLAEIYPFHPIQWRALAEAREAVGDRAGAMEAAEEYRRWNDLIENDDAN